MLPPAPDPVLLPFLRAAAEKEADARLERLLHAHAEPTIRRVIGRKLRVSPSRTQTPDEENAQAAHTSSLTRIIERLRRCRDASRAGDPIADFGGYVAVTASRACDEVLRAKYPARYRLKNRLRYLLGPQQGFALWPGGAPGGGLLCGFAEWKGQALCPAPSRLRQLCDDPHVTARLALGSDDARFTDPARLVDALFRWVGHPVALDDLVSVLAALWVVGDAPVQSLAPSPNDAPDLADMRDIASEAERREYLRFLWAEIGLLNAGQRAALLLHLGEGLALLTLAGVANLRQIAAALEMPAEDLARLWNDLPLGDADIARRLGVTRQQVINLRLAARHRLARRAAARERS